MSQKKRDAAIFRKWEARAKAAGVTPFLSGHTEEEQAVIRHLARLIKSGEYEFSMTPAPTNQP